MSPSAIVVLGCLAVLVFDTAGALLVRRFPFDYQLLAPVSLALYAGTGYLAAAAADVWLLGAVGGAAAAATDATVGWRIGRALGVDRAGRVSDGQEAVVAIVVTGVGAVLGAATGLLA